MGWAGQRAWRHYHHLPTRMLQPQRLWRPSLDSQTPGGRAMPPRERLNSPAEGSQSKSYLWHSHISQDVWLNLYLQLALHMNRDFIIWNFFFIIFNKLFKNIVKLLIKRMSFPCFLSTSPKGSPEILPRRKIFAQSRNRALCQPSQWKGASSPEMKNID